MNDAQMILEDATQYGTDLHIDLSYPHHSDVKAFVVGLSDVRAADCIRISYDFIRDGWIIQQPVWINENETNEWREMAFLKAWQLLDDKKSP